MWSRGWGGVREERGGEPSVALGQGNRGPREDTLRIRTGSCTGPDAVGLLGPSKGHPSLVLPTGTFREDGPGREAAKASARGPPSRPGRDRVCVSPPGLCGPPASQEGPRQGRTWGAPARRSWDRPGHARQTATA